MTHDPHPTDGVAAVPPVGVKAFAATMQALGPFEPEPQFAVAVSGGADSTALALLADRWARARGGKIVALTVDHRLRPESTSEARAVGRRLARRGIRHVRLTWRRDESPHGAADRANLQARARAARYRLMIDWCKRRGILHLLAAHHRDDQAETLLLRLARGSGVDGLAAMAPVVHTEGPRILRPLLDIPRAALEATLRRAGQRWIEDPSNRNPHFARVRMRALREALGEEGLSTERLSATASRLRRARASLEAAAANILARAAIPSEHGFVRLDRAALLAAPEDIALRVLARLVATVGGGAYVPRREGTERLLHVLAAATMQPRTGANDRVLASLGGTLIVGEGGDRLLIVREPSAVAAAVALPTTGDCLWDGRFRVRYLRNGARGRPSLSVGALTDAGARMLLGRDDSNSKALSLIPRRARATLPALFDGRGFLAGLPSLVESYGRPGSDADSLPVTVRFVPPLPLVGTGFMLV